MWNGDIFIRRSPRCGRHAGTFVACACIAAGFAETDVQRPSFHTGEDRHMDSTRKRTYLRIALIVIGAIFVVGIPSLVLWLWPDGWTWTPRQYEYEQMIMGIYATLGVFLIRAARDPMANASLIWFTVWSSVVHAGIMLAQAIVDPTERANLLGDIPALFIVALLLWYLMPKGERPS